MHVQSRWAANLNLSVLFFFFLRFSLPLPSSLLQLCISNRKSPQTDTWCQYCQRESCLYLEYNSAGSRPWDRGGGGGGGGLPKNFFRPFGPQFSLKIRGGGGGPPRPLPWIRHCINASRIIIAWLVTHLYRAKHKQFAKHQYHGCQPWLHRH